MSTRYFVGLDLGQRQDHSAIAVVERQDQFRRMVVRYLERVPLGTPYPAVVERVAEIVGHEHLVGQCGLAVDGTGVGAPVVDLLRRGRLGCAITAVTITGGERVGGSGGVVCVPKRDLMAEVQLMLERGELVIARRLKEAGSLVRELMDVRMSLGGGPGASGRVRLGADGGGEHDDLVIALALGCWLGKRPGIGFGGRRLL